MSRYFFLTPERSGVDDKNIEEVAMIIKNNKSITNINLSNANRHLGYNAINSYETKELAMSLKQNSVLISLNLSKECGQVRAQLHWSGGSEGNCGDIKREHCTDYALLREVLAVNVGVNSIGDEGAKEISAAIKINTSLTSLYLDDNNIEDEGAKELAAGLMLNSTLSKLFLRECWSKK